MGVFVHMGEMMEVNLQIDVTEAEDCFTVKLAGEIDVYTAQSLKQVLLPLTEKTNNHLYIDLQQTTYMDSTGLGVFISAYKSSKQHGSKIEFRHVEDQVLRLFKVTGLDEIMHLTDMKERRANGTV